MPHLFLMCLALAGALFAGSIAGLAYFQLKLDDPEKDGYFKAQKKIAEAMNIEGWAKFQRSKAVRMFSFVIALALMLVLMGAAIWQGYLAFK